MPHVAPIPAPPPPSPATPRWQTVACIGSLTLNLVLTAGLLRPTPTPTGLPSAPTDPGDSRRLGKTPALNPDPDASAGRQTLRPAPPFRWNEIESADYRQYIANLRAVGCPEPVIRDLIGADLNQLYAPRAAAIWQRKTHAYWQKYENDSPTPVQLQQLLTLGKEQAAVFRDLLGASFSQQGQIDLLHMQLHGDEQQLLFLPAAQREAALAALSEAGMEAREMELQNRNQFSPETDRELYGEKLDALAAVLSPEELAQFRLRCSPTAAGLRAQLQYFHCTEEEFSRLLDAQEQNERAVESADAPRGTTSPEQVRQILGDERAKDFVKATDMYYQNARQALEETGEPSQTADDAWRISHEILDAAERLAKNSQLAADERQRQLRQLRDQADRELRALLGDKASRLIRRNLDVVLSTSSAARKP